MPGIRLASPLTTAPEQCPDAPELLLVLAACLAFALPAYDMQLTTKPA